MNKPAEPASQSADAPLTPDQQCTLQALMRAKAEEAISMGIPKGGIFPMLWSRFNNHFRLSSYKQLPQSRMSEAIAYLMRLKLEAKIEEKPIPNQLPPAILGGNAELGGKYKDYLEEVEAWRKSTRAGYERLYRAGIDLVEAERVGSAMTEACAAFFAAWLKETALSSTSVFYEYLDSCRAPVILAANLNAKFESVVDVSKRRKRKVE